MKLTLEMSLDNDTLADPEQAPEELARIFQHAITRISAGMGAPEGTAAETLWDSNGNNIGYWIIKD